MRFRRSMFSAISVASQISGNKKKKAAKFINTPEYKRRFDEKL